MGDMTTSTIVSTKNCTDYLTEMIFRNFMLSFLLFSAFAAETGLILNDLTKSSTKEENNFLYAIHPLAGS